ncbi:MAG: hypothetical protein QOF25_5807, partial [Mycobacterium sp.]|nr:hypothetical protein [Mycobacterium sp.]
ESTDIESAMVTIGAELLATTDDVPVR